MTMTDTENQFLWAIKNGEIDEVKSFVEKDSRLVNKELQKRYPLHHAADYGQEEVIDYLLTAGAEVNKADEHGITPLLAAIYEGHISCIKLLLSKGADKNGKTPDGSTYMEVAETEEVKNLLK